MKAEILRQECPNVPLVCLTKWSVVKTGHLSSAVFGEKLEQNLDSANGH